MNRKRANSGGSKQNLAKQQIETPISTSNTTNKRGRGRPSGSQQRNVISRKDKQKEESQSNKIYAYLDMNDGQNTTADGPTRRTRSNTNENLEEKKSRPSRSKEGGGSEALAKKFLENDKFLKETYDSANTSSAQQIPESLEGLVSSDEENSTYLSEAGRRFDAFMGSDAVNRIKAEHELRISFDVPLFENIGQLKRVFRLKNAADLNQIKIPIDLLEVLFFASPNSLVRNALLDRIHFIAFPNNGIQVPFDKFMVLLSYVFQIAPKSLGSNHETLLRQMTTTMAHFVVEDEEEMWTILRENIITFLDCWCYFRFTEWQTTQIIALMKSLARLYLDKHIVDIRHRLASVIQMTLKQLTKENQLEMILREFGTRELIKCAEDDYHRILVLFKLFLQFEEFMPHKMVSAHAILRHLISPSAVDHQHPEPPSLGDLLQDLPVAVKKLKNENRITELYLIYNQLIDAITIDHQLLLDQNNQSLEVAEAKYREASALLTKKNINDKMIDIWARSHHRIREVLQNRRNSSSMDIRAAQSTSSLNRLTSKIYYSSSDEAED